MIAMRSRFLETGFSLTEFLVSVVIIAIGLLSVVALTNFSQKSIISNDVKSRSVDYLKEEMIVFERGGYQEAVESFQDGVQYDASEGLPEGFLRWFWVFHDDPLPGMARIRIEVSWKQKDLSWNMKTETYITKK